MFFDDFVDLAHEADGFGEDDDGLLVIRDVNSRKSAGSQLF